MPQVLEPGNVEKTPAKHAKSHVNNIVIVTPMRPQIVRSSRRLCKVRPEDFCRSLPCGCSHSQNTSARAEKFEFNNSEGLWVKTHNILGALKGIMISGGSHTLALHMNFEVLAEHRCDVECKRVLVLQNLCQFYFQASNQAFTMFGIALKCNRLFPAELQASRTSCPQSAWEPKSSQLAHFLTSAKRSNDVLLHRA